MTNIAAAFWNNAVDVLLVPGNVIVVVGLLTIVARLAPAASGQRLAAVGTAHLRRDLLRDHDRRCSRSQRCGARSSTPPARCSSRFAVLAVLGADAFVARVRQWRTLATAERGHGTGALWRAVVA